jgi:hypothetical protein
MAVRLLQAALTGKPYVRRGAAMLNQFCLTEMILIEYVSNTTLDIMTTF